VGKKLPDLSANALREWLDLLSGRHDGTIKLINMFLSQKHRLLERALLRSFLVDCLSLRAKTVDDVLASFVSICARDDKYFGLCAADPSSIKGTLILGTSINSRTFLQFILARPKTRIKSVLLPEPKSHTDADEKTYIDSLAKATSRVAWYQATGTLGKPFPYPSHVWLTHISLLEAEILADKSHSTKATKIRDALGLIDTRDNTYLLSLQFSAANLLSITNLKMARPSFADNGNKRFAVYLNKNGESVYREKWGLTVNLGKLKAVPHQVINGVPERICKAIPLSTIGAEIQVQPIGWVVGNRGEEVGIDDDLAFIDRLRGRSNLNNIRLQFLKYANKP